MKMNKLFSLLAACSLLLPSLSSCEDTPDIEFKDYYVAFNPDASGPTRILCTGAETDVYVVHLCSTTPDAPVTVTYSVTADGLEEGVDYRLESASRTIRFLPGIFDQRITVHWLSHALSADGTLTFRLEDVDADLVLGYPGPAGKNRSLTITKYKP